MRVSKSIVQKIPLVVSYLFILLFVYATVSKLLDFENFQVQLGQSPLLSAFAGWVSWGVLLIELFTAGLLVFEKTRRIGLYMAFALMTMFTTYIVIILNFSSYVPCSCGGVLEKMGWTEHLVFNIAFILIALLAILWSSSEIRKDIIISLCTALTGFGLIWLTYALEENYTKWVNPFNRKFPQGVAIKVAETELWNHNLYIAGYNQRGVYIADSKAPLYVFKFDTSLKHFDEYKISIDKEDFPFRKIQTIIEPPHFWMVDGTVPVIYKGKTDSWQANVEIDENIPPFSKFVMADTNRIHFRTQYSKFRENVLGQVNFIKNDKENIIYNNSLLEKQTDGVFDTDGMLIRDKEYEQTIYLYYYRNQYIVIDKKLELMHKGATIDTFAHAHIKIIENQKTGERKLSSNPLLVNQLSTASSGHLIIKSNIKGQFEPKEMWDKASIMDIYNILDNQYINSFYVHNIDKYKVKGMILNKTDLYLIIGNHLVKYKITLPL